LNLNSKNSIGGGVQIDPIQPHLFHISYSQNLSEQKGKTFAVD
jgi:hypothetical protein